MKFLNARLLVLRWLPILFFSPVMIQAQDGPVKMDYTPPSPNASALAKYGDIPVGNYTGIPDIKIPVYTINTKYLNLPVYLSYHAGGIRVEETASSVGLGWTLNAGGIISRTVMGLNDEKEYKGFIRTGPIPPNNNIEYITTYEKYQKGELDGQADVFNFNFGEYVGKFVINKSQEVVKAPWSRMKLNFELGIENSIDQLVKWVAIGEDGTKYFFENKEYTTVLETKNLLGGDPPITELPTPYVSSWYLTKIVSSNGIEEYNFQYEPYTMEYYENIVETNYSLGSKAATKYRSKTRVQGQRLIRITFPGGSLEFSYSQGDRCDLIGDKALEKIVIVDGDLEKEFQLGYSYFDQGSNAPWSTCPTGEVDLEKRLRLDFVTEDPLTIAPKKHSFEYNEDSFLPDRFSHAQDHWGYYNGKNSNNTSIPEEYFSKVINGNLVQSRLIGADRTPDLSYLKAGTLKKIVYPTGGYTVFDFGINHCQSNELPNNVVSATANVGGITPAQQNITVTKISRPFVMLKVTALISPFNDPSCYLSLRITGNGLNRILKSYSASTSLITTDEFLVNFPITGTYTVSAELSSPGVCSITEPYNFTITWENELQTIDKIASGLRINKITDYPINATKKSQFFKYELPDGHTSGSVVTTPKYGYFYQEYDPYQGNFLYYVRTQFTNNPLVLTQGGVVGYSRVVVTSDSLCSTGYTELMYTSPQDFPDNYNNTIYPDLTCLEFPFAPAESNEWKRGLLLSKATFKNEGGIFKIVNRELNKYSYNDFSYETYAAVTSVKTGIYALNITTGGFSEMRVQRYKFTPHKQLLYQTINQTFYENNCLTDSITYTYNNDNFLSYSRKNINGKVHRSNYYYPSFYQWNPLMDSMVNVNMIKQVITMEDWIETANTTYLTSAQTTEFSQSAPGAFLPKAFWSFTGSILESVVGGPSQFDVVRNRSLYERDALIVKRDIGSNVTELLDRNNLRVAYLWDFAKRNVIAKALQATSSEIYYTSFEEKLVGSNTNATSKTGNNARILSGTPLAITSAVSPSVNKDYKLVYWWKPDLQSDWQIQIEDYANFQSGQPIQTSKVTGYIDELRFSPNDSQMTTYTHTSGVGITSATDPNNVTTIYVYDQVGRLQVIKDGNGNILNHAKYNYQTVQQQQ